MENLFKFIVENLTVAAIFGIGAGVAFSSFAKMSREEQKANIVEWLVWAVTLAEKQYGAGMGKIKLREVYANFVQAFPAAATWMSFQTFSELVDDALKTMRNMLQNNSNAAKFVNGQDKDNELEGK